MRRNKLVWDIYNHADVINANKTTLAFLLAAMTDKALTKFHKDFMKLQVYTNN